MIEPVPNIIVGDMQRAYTTGYALRKGGALNSKYCIQLKGYVALVCYRAVEALLNYMEASYERTGTLDATALGYWQAIRSRAGISTDIDATIAATEMDKEAENDWGLIPVESYLLTRHCITSVANGGVKCWPKLCATWMSAVGEQWIN